MARTWYQKPVPAFFVFAALSLLLAFAARTMELGDSSSTAYHLFSVRFEYFGMDAQTMERLVAVPLEEVVAGLPGLMDMETQCQYGQCSGTFYFYPQRDSKSVYLALRDAVDTLYRELPEAVQKPRIYSSSGASGEDTVISLVVPTAKDGDGVAGDSGLRSHLENQLKPRLESVEGVSEVVVSGGGVEEILVHFDQDRMAAGSINPAALGQIIQEANALASGTWLEGGGIRLPLVFDTRIKTLDQIRRLPVQTGEEVAPLSRFARIEGRQRPPEEIVRVNGEECLSVAVKAGYDGNLTKISHECRRILEDSFTDGDYRILYDRGEEFTEIIRNILTALVQSLVLILVLVPCFFPQTRITVLLLVFLPATVVWTWGQLQLAGFSLNRHTLSGMTIALGLVADAPFVVAEFWTNRRREDDDRGEAASRRFFSRLPGLQKGMAASTLTTVLVFVPLYCLDHILPGIREVAVTMGLMVLNSLVLAALFFPVFLEAGGERRRLLLPGQLYLPVQRFFVEKLLLVATAARNRTGICVCLFFAAALVLPVLTVTAGKSLSLDENPSYIAASVEYPTDTAPAAVDADVADFVRAAGGLNGVTFVTSRSETGVCRLELGLEPAADYDEVVAALRQLENRLKQGHLYLNVREAAGRQVHEMQIGVVGDQPERCRDYARRCVEEAGKREAIVQGVMNFKEVETVVLVRPLRSQLARLGLNLEEVAQSLRWLIFGPVVDKWIQPSGEEDIRVAGHLQQELNLSSLQSMTVPVVSATGESSAGGAGGLPLSALAQTELVPGQGKLYRLNGRPCAYFTLHVAASSTQSARQQVEELLEELPLDRGYGYHFSREVRELPDHYRLLALSLAGSVAGIFLLLCALREKPAEALLVSALIPASLALPLGILAATGKSWESGDVVGMVIVAGLAVNNGIYLVESTKRYSVINIREKIASILVTSLSTIAGSIPLLLCESGTFAASLAFFMVWGTAGSMAMSLLVFPAVIDRFFGDGRRRSASGVLPPDVSEVV